SEAVESLDRLAQRVLNPGSTTALARDSRDFKEGGGALYFAFGVALLVVFMVLASQFESLVHPFTVLLAVPLAVTGALATLLLATLLHRPGGTINLYSEIGMVLLIGLVTKNSILLVEYTNQLKARGMETLAAVIEAGRIRLRPILMTSVATLMGAIPVMIGLGAGSTSRRPLGADIARLNPPSFNFVTVPPSALRTQVIAQLTASYDLFTGGQKLAELSRSGAALEGAHAGELAARFAAALLTESDYYAVLAGGELARVARERVQRAEQELAVARARVVSGAAVQTDSLQLRLELTQARVGQLVRESVLRIARLELGRRVGAAGPVDAAPLDTTPAPELPLTLADAITQAATQGPQYRVAQANERAAAAAFRGQLGTYLP